MPDDTVLSPIEPSRVSVNKSLFEVIQVAHDLHALADAVDGLSDIPVVYSMNCAEYALLEYALKELHTALQARVKAVNVLRQILVRDKEPLDVA